MKRQAAALVLFLSLVAGLSGCLYELDYPSFDIFSVSSYREIPGITEEEIFAIQALSSSREYFSYGMTISNEAFIQSDGRYAGFAFEFCELLSGLFEISFILELHSWESLHSGIDNWTIDFTGEFSPSFETRQIYIMSHPIAERRVIPPPYTPVSMTTLNPDLAPLISVLDKYIEAGGIDRIFQLFIEGNHEFAMFNFDKSLTDAERAYLDNLSAQGATVPIGAEADNYPVSFYNARDGEYQGYAIDNLAEIISLTGINFEIITEIGMPWTTILNMLISGEIALVSELLFSEERRDNFLWSEPYASSRYALLSKADFPQLEMFQVIGHTVGIIRGSAYEEMYKLFFPNNNNIVYYDTQAEMLDALESGEIDLLMASESVLLALRNFRERPNYKVNILFSEPPEESFFGFNINEEILSSIVRKAQSYIDAGRIEKIWTNLVFDYESRMASERLFYTSMFVIFLSLAFLISFFLLMKNSRIKKRFENQAATLTAMYNTIPDMVFCMDTDLKYINCNRSYEEFTGFYESDVIGKTDLEIFANAPNQKQIHEYMNNNIKVLKEIKTVSVEESGLRHDNVDVILKTTKTPLFKNDKIIGLLAVARDITDLKDAEITAQEASRAKTNFLAKMSHEIRTPMNAIIGMTELALREKELDAAHKYILTVKQAGAHLLSIINDILDFSKIEMGKLEITPNDYLFSSLINDVISIIRMKVMDSQLRFAVFVDSKIPNSLIGDETRIRQVLLNILNNAVKYTEKGFVIFSIYGKKTDENTVDLVMEVKDTGKGIKTEDIERMFGEYVQVDHESNTGIEGVGLGLPITKNILKAMGGDISVNSDYGMGSTFTVTLPQKIRSPNVLASVEGSNKVSVIVYERREIYANSVFNTISNLDVDCKLVSSDPEFGEALKNHEYSFIFISYSLFVRNRSTIYKYGENAKVVALAEFGEAIPDKKIRILAMPVYSIPVANILNGTSENFNFTESDENVMRFTAPDAHVLIVDDIATNLNVAQGLMLPYKMHIDLCKGGREAIEAIIFKHYDLIFMDHKMPDMDGVECTRHIRAMGEENHYYLSVPIIALTANAVAGTKEEFLRNGFNDFLSKPIDTVMLNLILEKWIPKEKQISILSSNIIPAAVKSNKENDFKIEGVDINRGVYLSGGKFALYLSTLDIFYKDGIEKLTTIKDCVESGNLHLYTIHVHALKSASANIGAIDLSLVAQTLEIAGEQKNWSVIEERTPEFLVALELLLDKIGNALTVYKNGAGAKKSSCDMEIVKKELAKLKTALDSLDAGIINKTIDNLREMTQGSSIEASIDNISDIILIGEYERAVSFIENVSLENLNEQSAPEIRKQ